MHKMWEDEQSKKAREKDECLVATIAQLSAIVCKLLSRRDLFHDEYLEIAKDVFDILAITYAQDNDGRIQYIVEQTIYPVLHMFGYPVAVSVHDGLTLAFMEIERKRKMAALEVMKLEQLHRFDHQTHPLNDLLQLKDNTNDSAS